MITFIIYVIALSSLATNSIHIVNIIVNVNNKQTNKQTSENLTPDKLRLYVVPRYTFILINLMIVFYAVAIVAFYLFALDATLFLTTRVRGVLGSLRPVAEANGATRDTTTKSIWKWLWKHLNCHCMNDIVKIQLIEDVNVSTIMEPQEAVNQQTIGNDASPTDHPSGKGVVEITTLLRHRARYPPTDTQFERRPSPLSNALQSLYERISWVLIAALLIGIVGILTRIAYFFKRNVDCSVGRYLISICQGLSYCGFITVITWCQQHGYGKCGITFIFQLLTGILTVVAVVISPIPIREQYTVAGICMYPAVASVYPNLVAAGFIGYALMMLANVINAFYYLPPEIDDGSEIDDGELPEATPRDTTRTRLARLLRLSRRRSTRKQRRRLIHRYRRRASSLGGEVNARGARMGYVRRTTNSEGPSSFSDVNSWFSYPRSNGSTRSSNRPAALRDGSGDSAAPWVIPVCSVAHIIPDPLRWISIDEAHTRISPSMLLRTFTRHSVLFTDVMAGLCMIIIGITYITDVWQRLTNMPIVISWIAICYASLNSLRYWHRRDVRLALLYPIPRMDQSREQVHILTDNGTHSFYQSPVEEVDTTDITDTTATTATTGSGGSTNNDDDNKRSGAPSILEIPAALSGPVAPPRQLSESSEAHTIDMSHLDGQPGNANLFVKTIGAVSESPTLSIETFGPIHHVNDAEDVDAAIDAAIDGDSIITSHSTDTE